MAVNAFGKSPFTIATRHRRAWLQKQFIKLFRCQRTHLSLAISLSTYLSLPTLTFFCLYSKFYAASLCNSHTWNDFCYLHWCLQLLLLLTFLLAVVVVTVCCKTVVIVVASVVVVVCVYLHFALLHNKQTKL